MKKPLYKTNRSGEFNLWESLTSEEQKLLRSLMPAGWQPDLDSEYLRLKKIDKEMRKKPRKLRRVKCGLILVK